VRYYIVTGSSKGLGESLVRKLTGEGNHVFCISRNKNEKLQDTAQKQSALSDYYEFDLSSTEEIPQLMERIFNRIEKKDIDEICLINNAGMLSPIKPLQEIGADEIRSNVTINLIAPMVMTAEFLKLTKTIKSTKKIINISSKASRSPRPQWTCYNSSKAGIDNITQTVAIEQDNADYPVKIISFYPGAMDTAMRKENQKTKPLFRRAVEFIKSVLSTKKSVAHHPDFVAGKLVTYMNSAEFGKELFVSFEDIE